MREKGSKNKMRNTQYFYIENRSEHKKKVRRGTAMHNYVMGKGGSEDKMKMKEEV